MAGALGSSVKRDVLPDLVRTSLEIVLRTPYFLLCGHLGSVHPPFPPIVVLHGLNTLRGGIKVCRLSSATCSANHTGARAKNPPAA